MEPDWYGDLRRWVGEHDPDAWFADREWAELVEDLDRTYGDRWQHEFDDAATRWAMAMGYDVYRMTNHRRARLLGPSAIASVRLVPNIDPRIGTWAEQVRWAASAGRTLSTEVLAALGPYDKDLPAAFRQPFLVDGPRWQASSSQALRYLGFVSATGHELVALDQQDHTLDQEMELLVNLLRAAPRVLAALSDLAYTLGLADEGRRLIVAARRFTLPGGLAKARKRPAGREHWSDAWLELSWWKGGHPGSVISAGDARRTLATLDGNIATLASLAAGNAGLMDEVINEDDVVAMGVDPVRRSEMIVGDSARLVRSSMDAIWGLLSDVGLEDWPGRRSAFDNY